jgi:hypothetical protein
MNVGLRAAQGSFFLSVNQDVELHQGWLESLLEALAMPGVGIVGCKLFYPDGMVQHAGGIVRWPQAFVDHYGYRQPDDGRWDEMRSVDYVTGAAWGFRRAVVEQIGLLDEGYWPGYYEEVDYCFRARRAGWQVIYTPKATGVHHESVSLKKTSIAYLKAFHRGRLRFAFKNYVLGQIRGEFLSSEREYVQDVPMTFARQVLAPVYFSTLLNMPDLPDEVDGATSLDAGTLDLYALISEIIPGLSELYLLALHPKRGRSSGRSDTVGATAGFAGA